MNPRIPALIGLVAGLAALTACAGSADKALNDAEDRYMGTTGAELRQLRLDVFPGQSVDGTGAVRALPQTTSPVDATDVGLVEVGVISLSSPGSLSGFVTGALVTPWADTAELPSTPGPVDATVRIALPGSVQNYTAETEDGVYDAIVVPSELPYLVSVVPDDPAIPFGVRELAFRADNEVLDFDLGYGVSLYGRVLTGTGEPVQNARVQAVDELGVASSQTRTDAGGWYVLRVAEDAFYTVVCAGRDHGRDPVLNSEPTLALPDTGSQVDFSYPNLAGTFATGRVVDASGLAISDVTVRFTATSLTGYEGLAAALVVEDSSDANGNFEASLLDGVYEVKFLPPAETDPALDHGALVQQDRRSDTGGLIFGTQTLPALVPLGGEVLDPAGQPVSGARVTCSEIDLAGRSWSTFTGKSGRYEMMLPPGPVSCQVQPPGERADQLAWTNEQIDTTIDDGHVFEIRSGTLVTGEVRLGGVGEPFALVEVRDATGVLLGSALSHGESDERGSAGNFSVRVDLPAESLP